MRILVVADHDGKIVLKSTRHVLSAASKLGDSIDLLLTGTETSESANAAKNIPGIHKILTAQDASLHVARADNIAALIVQLAAHYDYILMSSTTYGKNILPRAAALLDIQMISDVIEIVDAKTFKRPFYAGNAIQTLTTSEQKILMTVRPTAFDAVAENGGAASIEPISIPADQKLLTFVSAELSQSERPELTAARVVVSGGRALASADNFKLVEDLADALGGAVGASRAAVDAGYVPNDYQVGQTGKVVAPELYIAVGISGAIQHMAGMKDSKVIVAINKDADAPIFQVADYGLVGDLFSILPELTQKIRMTK